LNLQYIKLVLFVSLGILLFALGKYFIDDTKQLFINTFSISAQFSNVNGLQVANNVRFAGINLGTAEKIEVITDSVIHVIMVVDISKQKFVKKDATAIIGYDGLIGNIILNIFARTRHYAHVKDQDIITTTILLRFDDLLLNQNTTAKNDATITNDLAEIRDNIRFGKGSIGKLFMDTVFDEYLDKTMINLKQDSKGFKQNMDAAQKVFC